MSMCNIRDANILEKICILLASVWQEVKRIKRYVESKANLIRTDINWTLAVDNDKSARNFPGFDIMIAGQRASSSITRY